MIRLAVFASGSGSNASQIMKYFKGHPQIGVGLLVYNRKEAPVFQRAQDFEVESVYFQKSVFSEQPNQVLDFLKSREIDFLILAGFLLQIPKEILEKYPERVLNIHPALLPDFGGKGMFGRFVHKAVKESGKNSTGITIHLADTEYDSGKIIFQATCPVFASDSDSDIAARVLELEHEFFPFVIEQFVLSSQQNLKTK